MADTPASNATCDAVVFDLGGVLIEQDTESLLAALGSGLDSESWRSWMLDSDAARLWETGGCTFDTFAGAARSELGLADVDIIGFRAAFSSWVVGPFDRSASVLDQLSPAVARLCLSNCNELHWSHLVGLGIDRWFSGCFLSHHMGVAKPDPRAFQHVASAVGSPAARLLFLDDNPLNVSAARRLGWQADLVHGPEQALGVLERRGLLASSR